MLHVTAGIVRENNRILICQRNAQGDLPLLWEFPGGKLEEGETLEECLVRECREELEVDIRITGKYAETEYEYPNQRIAFTFFDAEIIDGEICAKVHNDIKWVQIEELKDHSFCPADIEIVEALMK